MRIDASPQTGQSGRGQCIAVLDDSSALLDLMKDLLEDEGYRVAILRTSEGAHKALKELQPALIIIDLMLEKPDSGWQIIQILTLDPHTKEIPIIICSAATAFLKAHEERIKQLGYPVLDKPFDLEDLLTMVATALAATHLPLALQ